MGPESLILLYLRDSNTQSMALTLLILMTLPLLIEAFLFEDCF